jgi:hypothetical protein
MGDGRPEHRPVQLRPFPVHRNPAYNEIPSRRGVNGWAVASLILGLGGAMVGGFVAGIVALAQVKDRPQKGRGLAIAGLIFSAMWTLLFGIAILVGAIHLP